MKSLRPWLVCLALLVPLAMPRAAMAEQKARAVSSDEAQLQKFNAFADALLKKTKASIEARMESLDEKATSLFEQGTEIAMASMTAVVRDRLAPFKSVLFGAPPEADQIYADGKKQFEQDMKTLSVRVANLMADEISGAKNEIKTAQAKIAEEHTKLPASVKARAAKQQKESAAKLLAFVDRAAAALR